MVGSEAAADVDRRERIRRLGMAVGCGIGGIGAGIMLLVLPFVTPAFRRFALPYVPATPAQLERVVSYVRGRRGKVVDLGSGDGRVVIALAKEGHYTVGYELNLWLVLYSRWRALWSGVYHNTEFHRRNLWKVNLRDYETVIFFGVEQMMEPLGEKLKKEASSSVRVVACRFSFPQWTPTTGYDAGPDSVWIYDHIHSSYSH